jgi:hypothetical protein
MSLSVLRALREGLRWTASRNGLLFVGVFTVVGLLGSVALDSAVSSLAESMLALDAEGEVELEEDARLLFEDDSIAPLALPIPGAAVFLLLLTWLLGWVAASVVVVRAAVADERESLPDDLVWRRLTAATANELLARVAVWTMVGIGLALLVVPGIALAVLFLFARPGVAVEDRNGVEAMVESVSRTKGIRLKLAGLLCSLAAVYVAIRSAGLLLTAPFAFASSLSTALALVSALLSVVFIAAANVVWLAVHGRTYAQVIEEGTEREAGGDDEEGRPAEADEWNDPPGVEW